MADHRDRAESLAKALTRGIESGQWEYHPERLDIYNADVEHNVERFAFQAMHCLRSRTLFPCLKTLSGIMPIDWQLMLYSKLHFPLDWMTSQRPWMFWSDLGEVAKAAKKMFVLHTASHPGREQFADKPFRVDEALTSVPDAVEGMRMGLAEFLTYRFSARKSDTSRSPGMQIRVHTQTAGLRVHYTPSYFFTPNQVLGAPTTPVDGWVQPGRYKFGAMGKGFPLKFDPADFDIPPQTEAHLVGI